MPFDIPRQQIFAVNEIDVSVDAAPHPFESENLAAIDENWRRETRFNPALFDGRIALLSQLDYSGRRLVGRCHVARYASFMLWRRLRPIPQIEHTFAHAVPVAADGALLAIRMAAHTVNGGRVYFAAGSFEPEDFRDGRVDVMSNMLREVREETGLDLSGLPGDPIFHAFSSGAGTALFRRFFLPEPADALAARVEAFIAADPQAEVSGAVVIRDADDLPDGLMPHMPPIIRWHFETLAGAGTSKESP
ncbi:MAG TPA: NUDIX hydrolase [Mesorhizobium sp.]|nr:NUDIX hydrolase [Mesorhizobium sp.]